MKMNSPTQLKSAYKSSFFMPVSRGLLQRKCACGGSSGLMEGCRECEAKKLTVQRQTIDRENTFESAPIAHEFPIQTKLTVGKPGDIYEQEADRVADEVMQIPEAKVQHNVGSEQKGGIQRKAIANSITPLQSSSTNSSQSTEVPGIVHDVLRSPGQPLDPDTQTSMKYRFGHDFSRVRIHTGGAAERSAKDVNANAYTVGHNVVFGANQFALGTDKGQRLLAHELTHVVQQIAPDTTTVNQIQSYPNASSIFLQRDVKDIIYDVIANKLNEDFKTHKSPYLYIRQKINELDSGDEDNVAAAFIKLQTPPKLDQFASTKEGSAILDILYEAIITGDVSDFERAQAARIIDAKKNHITVKEYIADTENEMIFPARNMGVTRSAYAVFNAKLSNGKVKVSYDDMHVEDEMFRNDLRTLGTWSDYHNGIELEPDRIVGVRLYDQGGVLVPVQALALIDYSNQLRQNTLSLAKTAFVSGLTLGFGGIAAGGSRFLVWGDRVAATYSVLSMVVNEHRDWILKNFPNYGQMFLDKMDKANSIVAYYGYARLGLEGIRFLRSTLGSALKDWRVEASAQLSSSESNIAKDIDRQTNKVLNELAEGEAIEAANYEKQHPPKIIEGQDGRSLAPINDSHPVFNDKLPANENAPVLNDIETARKKRTAPLSPQQQVANRPLAATGTGDVASAKVVESSGTQQRHSGEPVAMAGGNPPKKPVSGSVQIGDNPSPGNRPVEVTPNNVSKPAEFLPTKQVSSIDITKKGNAASPLSDRALPQQVAAAQVGKSRTRQTIQNMLRDIRDGTAPRRDMYKNRQSRLPTEAPPGGQKPVYIEYEVPTPGAKGPGGGASAGDRRIIYDQANNKYYYSGNFHAGGSGNAEGTAAKFVEITNVDDI
jgi:Domain of unknown function (DUF4157)